MQESMGLTYEPASEPLLNCVKWLFWGAGARRVVSKVRFLGDSEGSHIETLMIYKLG